MRCLLNALDGEQNLVGFDESEREQFEAAVARPTGWSDYQSSWLDAFDNLGDGELARELNEQNESSGASVHRCHGCRRGIEFVAEAKKCRSNG